MAWATASRWPERKTDCRGPSVTSVQNAEIVTRLEMTFGNVVEDGEWLYDTQSKPVPPPDRPRPHTDTILDELIGRIAALEAEMALESRDEEMKRPKGQTNSDRKAK